MVGLGSCFGQEGMMMMIIPHHHGDHGQPWPVHGSTMGPSLPGQAHALTMVITIVFNPGRTYCGPYHFRAPMQEALPGSGHCSGPGWSRRHFASPDAVRTRAR